MAPMASPDARTRNEWLMAKLPESPRASRLPATTPMASVAPRPMPNTYTNVYWKRFAASHNVTHTTISNTV